MVPRGELTDRRWEQISPLLPERGGRGGQWRDHRQVINGILWQARTGAPWRDVLVRAGETGLDEAVCEPGAPGRTLTLRSRGRRRRLRSQRAGRRNQAR
ncbi:transposase [Planomonospora parontospora]|uniref:transposase n=1 Tax=Planomonospora parontospora TaxID=58119 RepID=UPI001950F96E